MKLTINIPAQFSVDGRDVAGDPTPVRNRFEAHSLVASLADWNDLDWEMEWQHGMSGHFIRNGVRAGKWSVS